MIGYQEAWKRYCSIKTWREEKHHVDWQFRIDGDTLELYFQGSDEPIDWLRDFMGWPKYNKWLKLFLHNGFYKSLNNVLNDILKVDTEIFSDDYNITNLRLIGYSSGGALALMFAACSFDYFDAAESLKFGLRGFRTIEIFTFAAPQVSWIRKLKFMGNTNAVNVRLDRDIVPKIFKLFGYRENPGSRVILESPYKSMLRSHLPDSYTKAIGGQYAIEERKVKENN